MPGTDVELTKDDYAKKFTFNLSLKDKDNNALAGSFRTVIRDEDDRVVEGDQTVITKGEGTIELSHGQTAYIYGLPIGTKYSIAEKQEEGWFNVEALLSEGTASPGENMTASFTNVKMSTDTSLILGYKALTGTDGMNESIDIGHLLNSFEFQIAPISAEVEDTPVVSTPKAEEEETEPADFDAEQEPAAMRCVPLLIRQPIRTKIRSLQQKNRLGKPLFRKLPFHGLFPKRSIWHSRISQCPKKAIRYTAPKQA